MKGSEKLTSGQINVSSAFFLLISLVKTFQYPSVVCPIVTLRSLSPIHGIHCLLWHPLFVMASFVRYRRSAVYLAE